MAGDGIDGAFSDHSPVRHIDAAHARLRGEIQAPAAVERGLTLGSELFGEGDHRASFGRRIVRGGKVSRLNEFARARPRQWNELGCLPVAHGERAGLVEQQGMHVACGLHGLAGHGEDVEPEGAVDAGDADGGKKRTDRGRNERHEQRDQIGDVDACLQVDRNGRHGGDRNEEDQRQYGEQGRQGHLVRRLLPLGAFHEMDHAVEEAFARIGAGANGKSNRKSARCRRSPTRTCPSPAPSSRERTRR